MQKTLRVLFVLSLTVAMFPGGSVPAWAQDAGQGAAPHWGRSSPEQSAVEHSKDVAALSRILDKPDDPGSLKGWAIEALGNIGTSEAAKVLAEHITADISNMAPIRTAGPYLEPSSLVYPAVRELMKIGPSAIPAVLHELATASTPKWNDQNLATPCLLFLIEEMPKAQVRDTLENLLPTVASAGGSRRVQWALTNLPKYFPAPDNNQDIKRCPALAGVYFDEGSVGMLPVSRVASLMGLHVKRGSKPWRVTLTSTGSNPKSLTLQVNHSDSVRPEALHLPAAPVLRKGVMYVPLEALSDYFGWNGQSQSSQ